MNPAFLVAVVGLFGACIGSFLNVVVYRVPRGLGVADGRSRCPRCGHGIRWFDNVPVVSWLLLRARCRDCRAPISPRYPFVEALTAGLFVLAALRHPGLEALPRVGATVLLLSALVVVTFVDVDRREIPDVVTKPFMALGLLLSLLLPALHGDAFPAIENRHLAALLASGLGLVVGGGVLLVIRWLGRLAMGSEAMGMGDVKLLAMVGAFVGWRDALFVLLVASVGGALFGGLFVLGRGRKPAALEGGLSRHGGPRVPFHRALIRAPRRQALTVTAHAEGSPDSFVVGERAALDVVLPATSVWADEDVTVKVEGVVEAAAPTSGGAAVRLRPEPLPDAEGEWLATFALHRVSVPFGVFLAAGAAAMLLAGPEIRAFVLETWPRIVTGRGA